MSKFWESSYSKTICRKDTHNKAPIPLLRKIQRANKRVLGWRMRKITQISAVHAKFMAWPTQPRRATCLITKITTLLWVRKAINSPIGTQPSSQAMQVWRGRITSSQAHKAGKAQFYWGLSKSRADSTAWPESLAAAIIPGRSTDLSTWFWIKATLLGSRKQGLQTKTLSRLGKRTD